MAWEILKTDCVENAETYCEEVRAGKRPAIYTKKQFFEELEEAKKNGQISIAIFFDIRKDLVLATFFTDLGEGLDAHLAKLDENMLFTDGSDFAFVKKARFK